MKRRTENERGSAVVVALLMVTVMMLLGSAFLSVSLTETMISADQIAGVRAFHLAEAGLEHARVELASANVDELLTGSGVLLGNESLGFGTYTVAVSNNDGSPFPLGSVPDDTGGADDDRDGFVVLTSTGYYRNAERTVQAVVHQSSGPWSDWAVYGHAYVSAHGSGTVEGPVHTNGNIVLGNGTQIVGDATAHGIINRPTQVTGTSTSGAPRELAPLLGCPTDFGPSPLGPGVSFNSFTGDLTVSGDADTWFPSGTYYFQNFIKAGTGRLMIAPGDSVEIFVSGGISISGSGFNNDNVGAANLKLIGCGDNPAMLDAAPEWKFNSPTPSSLVIYAPGHQMRILGGGSITGSLVGKTIFKNGTGSVNVDPSLASSGGGSFSMVPGTWQELR